MNFDLLRPVYSRGGILFHDIFRKDNCICCIGPCYSENIKFEIKVLDTLNILEKNRVNDGKSHILFYTFPLKEELRNRDELNVMIYVEDNTVTLPEVEGTNNYIFLSLPKPPKNNNYFLSVSSQMKNENNVLEEWLDYHEKIGIEHFFLYDNNTTNFEEILSILKDRDVTLIKWPYLINPPHDELTSKLSEYYNAVTMNTHCVNKYGYRTSWLINRLDLDEFITIGEKNLREFISSTISSPENFDAIYLFWHWFTNNGEQVPVKISYIDNMYETNGVQTKWYCGGKLILNPKNAIITEHHCLSIGKTNNVYRCYDEPYISHYFCSRKIRDRQNPEPYSNDFTNICIKYNLKRDKKVNLNFKEMIDILLEIKNTRRIKMEIENNPEKAVELDQNTIRKIIEII